MADERTPSHPAPSVESESESSGTKIPAGTVAIVLAAGAGTRFHGPQHKLLAPMRSGAGPTVIESSLAHVLSAGFVRVVVVTGSVEMPDAVVHDPRVTIVHNARWAEGQSTSLRIGIDAARALGADVVVIGLGDQPFIEPSAWQRVARTDSPIAVASYSGRRGHPVRLTASVWNDLPESGDFGARDLIAMSPERVSQVDCQGSSTDIDTLEDLGPWT